MHMNAQIKKLFRKWLLVPLAAGLLLIALYFVWQRQAGQVKALRTPGQVVEGDLMHYDSEALGVRCGDQNTRIGFLPQQSVSGARRVPTRHYPVRRLSRFNFS
jgi:hypothetical protein